ncbi:heme-binding protein [Sphingomonas sp. PR090111-T3T-6A]|uniref:GlcG/HbpS family heme-binding protein n=1 Tax=Sphingomonas sp. PR090111-T3T-6A TaxID=685778 RepID=UPI0009FF6C77
MDALRKPLFGIQNTNDDKVVIFGGGAPVKHGDVVTGAVGASGGTVDQDIEVTAAIRTLGERDAADAAFPHRRVRALEPCGAVPDRPQWREDDGDARLRRHRTRYPGGGCRGVRRSDAWHVARAVRAIPSGDTCRATFVPFAADYRRTNSRRSALMTSAWVTGMPCGKPG